MVSFDEKILFSLLLEAQKRVKRCKPNSIEFRRLRANAEAWLYLVHELGLEKEFIDFVKENEK